MPLALFGIDSPGINLGITFVLLAIVAIWIALIVFTYSDARRRISDPFLIACSTAASFFPYVGTIVYTILRPPEFLEDVKEREVEMKASETRLRHLNAASCRKCGFPTEPDFVRCPACRSRVKDPCPSCSRPVGLNWKVCPYCEHTLIESKRSRSSGPKASSKRRPDEAKSAEGKRRKGSSDRAEEAGGSRRHRRTEHQASSASARETRADSPDRPKDAGSTPDRGRQAADQLSSDPPSSDPPARDATRSGRRKVVVADEPAPTKTINGGGSERTDRSPEAG